MEATEKVRPIKIKLADPLIILRRMFADCESEYNRGSGCGKTARPDLYGGYWVTYIPTVND